MALTQLPAEAQTHRTLIRAGGPFPYARTARCSATASGCCRAQARGYYREYTVKTPGARDRGARRIVCGGAPADAPEACYYTDDHYASFRRIVQ